MVYLLQKVVRANSYRRKQFPSCTEYFVLSPELDGNTAKALARNQRIESNLEVIEHMICKTSEMNERALNCFNGLCVHWFQGQDSGNGNL